MTLVICSPPTFPLRRITYCPTCEKRRRFSAFDAPWYGPTWTCCGCGDQWGDGEMLPRPFVRGWRKKNIERAKKVWDDAAGLTRADHSAWLRAELFEPEGGETP